MRKPHVLANAMLWAAAIIISAVLAAPHFLSLVLLPSLAVLSLLMAAQDPCSQRSDLS
jgi:hypothetical protein